MQQNTTFFKGFLASLIDQSYAPSALKVAFVVGSALFFINHGAALMQKTMSRDRWISASLTYLVPYAVNVHGQYTSRSRQSQEQ